MRNDLFHERLMLQMHVDGVVERLHERLNDIEETVVRVPEKIEDLEVAVKDRLAEIGELSEKLEELSEKLDELSEKLEEGNKWQQQIILDIFGHQKQRDEILLSIVNHLAELKKAKR